MYLTELLIFGMWLLLEL